MRGYERKTLCLVSSYIIALYLLKHSLFMSPERVNLAALPRDPLCLPP